MDTNVWGPSAWLFIHSIALAYPASDVPDKTKEYTRKFFESLAGVLPCAYCRENYSKHFDEYELNNALNSRAELFKWTVDLHNLVNESTGKKTISLEKAIQLIEGKYNTFTLKLSKWRIIQLSLCVLLIIGIVVYIRCKRLSRYFI